MVQEQFTQERLQNFFDFDFDDLLNADHEELEYIEQSHDGSMLIEKHEEGNERFKLWANYDGECICGVEIEYCGVLNTYRWETVLQI